MVCELAKLYNAGYEGICFKPTSLYGVVFWKKNNPKSYFVAFSMSKKFCNTLEILKFFYVVFVVKIMQKHGFNNDGCSVIYLNPILLYGNGCW